MWIGASCHRGRPSAVSTSPLARNSFDSAGNIFGRRMLAFITVLADVRACKGRPTHATRVGRRRRWRGWAITDRWGWTVGGVSNAERGLLESASLGLV